MSSLMARIADDYREYLQACEDAGCVPKSERQDFYADWERIKGLEEKKAGPSLADVLIDVLMRGADRAVFVRRPQQQLPHGMCVLLASVPAVRALGPRLELIMREAGDCGIRDFCTAPEGDQTLMFDILAAADRAPFGWVWFDLLFGRTAVTAVVFSGKQICEKAAAACNECGAPVSFDDRPAPGYTIEKTIR